MAIRQIQIVKGLLVEVVAIAGYAGLLYLICLVIEVRFR